MKIDTRVADDAAPVAGGAGVGVGDGVGVGAGDGAGAGAGVGLGDGDGLGAGATVIGGLDTGASLPEAPPQPDMNSKAPAAAERSKMDFVIDPSLNTGRRRSFERTNAINRAACVRHC